MKAVGLDVGSRTIGVAVTDDLGMLAHPKVTLDREGTKRDVARVAALVAEVGAEHVVVGLPLTLEGEIGPRAKRVMILVEALRAQLTIPVETWDERFSTAGAARGLDESGVHGDRRKAIIDQRAAAFLLQGWLDARRPVG